MSEENEGGCGGGGCSHLSIGNLQALLTVSPKRGTPCEVCLNTGEVISGEYDGPVKLTRNRISGIRLKDHQGYVEQYLWYDIADAWVL